MRFAEKILVHTIYHWRAMIAFGKCGKGSYCIKPLRIKNGKDISIANNVRILNSVRMETHRIFNDSEPIITIGNSTNIEQNVHITGGGGIFIGDSCSILGGAVITDINHIYYDVNTPITAQGIECKAVTIGDECCIGMYAVILPGTTLGRHVIVGANSVVKGEFPDNCVIAGVPAKIIKIYDELSKEWITVTHSAP